MQPLPGQDGNENVCTRTELNNIISFQEEEETFTERET